jgi:hypothetical protein
LIFRFFTPFIQITVNHYQSLHSLSQIDSRLSHSLHHISDHIYYPSKILELGYLPDQSLRSIKMQFTTLLFTLAAAVSAVPFPPEYKGNGHVAPYGAHHNSTLAVRQATGHATYYNTVYPTFSSCGEQPHDTDFVAAVAASFMPTSCGKSAVVTNDITGAQITVRIVDTCGACSSGSVAIDLTPTAFEALGASLGDGTVDAHWSFA